MSALSWPRTRLDVLGARAAVVGVAGAAGLALAPRISAMSPPLAPGVAADSVLASQPHTAPRPAAAGSVAGIVRSGGTHEPLAGARIELMGGGSAAHTDGAGAYLLTGVPDGTAMLRVSADGYVPLSLDVPAGAAVRLDVTLSHLPAPLTTVAPLTPPERRAELTPIRVIAPFTLDAPTVGGVDTLGRWHWTGSPSASTLASGEPDIFRVLADDPTIVMRPDWPPTLMNRGGGGDQTLVLLDGLPIWSPFHAGSALSAITPDAVAGLTLNDGAFSARYGGRLGGALDIGTRTVPQDAPTGGLALGPVSSRLMWGMPLRASGTSDGVLLAVRRSNRDVFARARGGTVQSLAGHWADGVGSVQLGGDGTSVTLLALASGDHLYPGRWDTRTAGVVWNQRIGTGAHGAHLETRAWDASFDATLLRDAGTAPPTLDDAVRHAGIASQLTAGATVVGASLEVLRVRYRVSGASGDTSYAADPPLDLRASPAIYAAFAERRWGTARSPVTLQAGLRATALRGVPAPPTPVVEPRVTVSLRPTPAVTATLGYARTHQFVQSLRNEASSLGAVVGVDLPAAAGLAIGLGAHARLALDGYVRSLAGLAVATPEETGLFATREFAVGSGRAMGGGAAASGTSGRVSWQATYGVGRSTVQTGTVTYHPPSELGRAASASVAVQASRLTQVRLATWASTSHQLVQLGRMGNEWSGADAEHQDAYETGYGTGSGVWAPDAPPQGTSSDTESPTTPGSGGQDGQSAQARLPAYLRVDLSATHDWHTGPGPGRLSAFVTLANVFNRANVAAYTPTSSTPLRTVTLTPRSLLAGVSWHY